MINIYIHIAIKYCSFEANHIFLILLHGYDYFLSLGRYTVLPSSGSFSFYLLSEANNSQAVAPTEVMKDEAKNQYSSNQ